MSDSHLSELAQRLVIGHKPDGRSIHDKGAKHELIMACLEPGASMTKIARACSVNANQLASCVRQRERSVAHRVPPSGEIVLAQALDFVRCASSLPSRPRPSPW